MNLAEFLISGLMALALLISIVAKTVRNIRRYNRGEENNYE